MQKQGPITILGHIKMVLNKWDTYMYICKEYYYVSSYFQRNPLKSSHICPIECPGHLEN